MLSYTGQQPEITQMVEWSPADWACSAPSCWGNQRPLCSSTMGYAPKCCSSIFFLRKNAAFSWMSLLLFNIWVFVLTGLGCYMPTCMHLCWQSYATYLHLCIYRSYVSKCSCGVALLLVIGITCMIFSCVCLWKSSTLYYIDYVGEELPLSAFCRTSVSEWEAFRSIDMDAEVCTCPASSVLFIIVHKII